jgi:predicted acyltransferase
MFHYGVVQSIILCFIMVLYIHLCYAPLWCFTAYYTTLHYGVVQAIILCFIMVLYSQLDYASL